MEGSRFSACGTPSLFDTPSKKPKTTYFPMRWNLPKPSDAGVAERGGGVEAAANGAGNQRAALLGQQPEHPPLRGDQCIDPRYLAIKVIGDGALPHWCVHVDGNAGEIRRVDRRIAHSDRPPLNFSQELGLTKRILAVLRVEHLWKRANDCESGGHDQIGWRPSDLRDCLEIGANGRDDHIAIAYASSCAARGILEPVRGEVPDSPAESTLLMSAYCISKSASVSSPSASSLIVATYFSRFWAALTRSPPAVAAESLPRPSSAPRRSPPAGAAACTCRSGG